MGCASYSIHLTPSIPHRRARLRATTGPQGVCGRIQQDEEGYFVNMTQGPVTRFCDGHTDAEAKDGRWNRLRCEDRGQKLDMTTSRLGCDLPVSIDLKRRRACQRYFWLEILYAR